LHIEPHRMNIALQLFEILIRRRQPEDLSYDINAAGLSFLAIVAMGYFITSMQAVYSQPLSYSIAQSITQGLAIYLVLKVANKENRFVQTITAIFGVSVILQMASLIILQIPSLAAATLFLTLWNFYLALLILKSALECSLLQSVVITIGYQVVVIFVLTLLFPELAKEFMSIVEESQKNA